MIKKNLVVYYTWSGHTRKMAEIIQMQTEANIFEIIPKTPYRENYNNCVNQAKQEIHDGYLPPIQNIDYDLNQYDIIYIGTPIWWGTMAPPLAAFLKENSFGKKIIMPFSTHSGRGKDHSEHDIKKICMGAKISDMYTTYEGRGRLLEKEIATWIKENNF